MSRTVESTLKSVDGVLDAKVLLSLPQGQTSAAKEVMSAGSGSVLIIGTTDLLLTVEEIKDLVSGAVGIIPGAVHVLIKSGKAPEAPLKIDHTQDLSLQGILFGFVLVALGGFVLVHSRIKAHTQLKLYGSTVS